MAKDKDNPDIPDDENSDGNGNGGGGGDVPGMPKGIPGAQRRKLKMVMSPSAQEVKFADMFGFTISPAHGIVKFGVMHPETGEFVVHTQIAMTPAAMVNFSNSLNANLRKVKGMQSKKKGSAGLN